MPRRSTDKFVPGQAQYSECRYDRQDLAFDLKGRVMLGPAFSATNCNLSIGRGVKLHIGEADFRECHIKSESHQSAWVRGARFEKCEFEGVFDSWRFGGSPVPTERVTSLTRCDFRKADLRDCEFYDSDLSSQRFRGWPTVVFLDPYRHRETIAQAPWPKTEDAQWWVHVLTGGWPPGFSSEERAVPAPVGVTLNAERVAKKLGITQVELRRVLKSLQDIVIT